MIKRIMLLIMGAALVTAMTAVSVPLASATPAPSKDTCKHGGYQALGFDDQSQCVEAANEAAKAGEPFPPPEECIPTENTECEQEGDPTDPPIEVTPEECIPTENTECPEDPGDPIEVCPLDTEGIPPDCRPV